LTKGVIKEFPITDAAGISMHPFSYALDNYLHSILYTNAPFGYGMCGGSIFKR
jgi:hypothetical protein